MVQTGTPEPTTATVAATSAETGKPAWKNPKILGGIGLAVVLLIGGVLAFSGGDEKKKAAQVEMLNDGDDKGEDGSDAPVSLEDALRDHLVIALNFDESLISQMGDSVGVEVLKSQPVFKGGLYGKGLVLDKNHAYRLPLAEKLFDGSLSSFTISFWVKNLNNQTPAFISDKPWKKGRGRKLKVGGLERWQWAPDDQGDKKEAGKSGVRHGWSMMTLVFSIKKKEVTIYSNGERMGSSSTSTIKTLDGGKYLYLGCDSNQKLNLTTPLIVDQLYIWNQKLSSKKIRGMYNEEFTF
jgi:hypothetical protein